MSIGKIYKIIGFIIFMYSLSIAQSDTIMVAISRDPGQDMQTIGITPLRLWSSPNWCGIYTVMSSISYGMVWNFYDFTNQTWIASDTGFMPPLSGAGGGMIINFYPACYEYYPFVYASDKFFFPETLSSCPFWWNYNYISDSLNGASSLRMGITLNGALHAIYTDYQSNYTIVYDRADNLCNGIWDGAVPVVSTSDGPWYAFYTDPFSNTIVLLYCRLSSDAHIIMLIDTMSGDMFYAGIPIQIDVTQEIQNQTGLPYNIGFVGDGVPFVDRDRNVHLITFGSDGINVVPTYVYHFFCDLNADTAGVVLMDSVTQFYRLIGSYTLAAGRSQMGQDRGSGILFGIWEEFIQDSERFVVSSTNDTFAPTRIKLAYSHDNGLTWIIDTLLESDMYGDNNEWLRFPVISPVLDTMYGSDRVIWGVYLDDDPGFAWGGQDNPERVDMLVGIKYVSLGVEEKPLSERKTYFKVDLNPVENHVRFSYELSVRQKVLFEIFDISGRIVDRIDEGIKAKGKHTTIWDFAGKNISSGNYFVIFKADDKILRRKLVITGKQK